MKRNDVAAYRLHAVTCMEIAQGITDPDRKVALMKVAQAWLALAEHSAKFETSLALATSTEQRVVLQQQQTQFDMAGENRQSDDGSRDPA